MKHDGYEFINVRFVSIDGRGTLTLVDHWPDKIAMPYRDKALPTGKTVTVDDNCYDFTVDNGIARYYIIHGLEDGQFVYAKKFYHITYDVTV